MNAVRFCANLQNCFLIEKTRLFSDIYITEGNTAAVNYSHRDCKERIL